MSRLVEDFARRLQHLDRRAAWSELSLVLVGHAGMRKINGSIMGRNAVTDVISLRYDPIPGAEGANGDVIVNVALAVAEASGTTATGLRKPERWDAACELALYIAHGCDHLAGAKDEHPADRRRMRRRELRWVRQAQARGLLAGLIED